MNAPERLPHAMPTRPNSPDSALSPADEHWRELLGQMGSDISAVLTSAMERVTVLTTTGKIDRTGLRGLRDEIERARKVGMIGQQMARYASGRIRQSPEQVSLTQLMREVLVQRAREATAKNLELRQSLRPAEVIVDPTLLHALAQALVDWALEQGKQAIDFRIELKPWPAQAVMSCRVQLMAPERVPGVVAQTDRGAQLDTMTWRLVQQIARTMALPIQREDHADHALLTIDFPRTVTEEIEGVSAVEMDHGFAMSENSKPLAGSHVLVVVSSRDLRSDVRDATRHMGLLVDFVNSVEEAEAFCKEGLPQAIVYESALAGDRFQRLRDEITGEVPGFVFVEIAAEGKAFELTSEGQRHHALVGRDVVVDSLQSALLFELSRTL